jgi:hypothetical protein
VLLGSMLLGGLNYNNNPALLFAFLLTAVANNSLVHAHLLLSGVRLKALHADPVFAGQPLRMRLRFEGEGARARPGLEVLGAGVHACSSCRPTRSTRPCSRSPRTAAAGSIPAACA